MEFASGIKRESQYGAKTDTAYGDAWSTLAWAYHAQQIGGHAWRVDIDPSGIADNAAYLTCIRDATTQLLA